MQLRDIPMCFIDSNTGWAGMDMSEGVFCSCPNQELGQAERTAREWQKLGIPGGMGRDEP